MRISSIHDTYTTQKETNRFCMTVPIHLYTRFRNACGGTKPDMKAKLVELIEAFLEEYEQNTENLTEHDEKSTDSNDVTGIVPIDDAPIGLVFDVDLQWGRVYPKRRLLYWVDYRKTQNVSFIYLWNLGLVDRPYCDDPNNPILCVGGERADYFLKKEDVFELFSQSQTDRTVASVATYTVAKDQSGLIESVE